MALQNLNLKELYTSPSQASFKRFRAQPELFEQYHEGFRHQVKQWPVNPVDAIHDWICHRFLNKKAKKITLPLVVADFGCGDAMLAQKLMQSTKKDLLRVHSFDLVSPKGNPKLVTCCDIANLPLKENCVDIGVFCLALMGTNLPDFIREAHRVLTKNGILKIAEVQSRFASTAATGGDEQETNQTPKANRKSKKKKPEDALLKKFLDVMSELGFRNTQMDRSNKMFFMMEFVKNGQSPRKDVEFTAKPCIYKRR